MENIITTLESPDRPVDSVKHVGADSIVSTEKELVRIHHTGKEFNAQDAVCCCKFQNKMIAEINELKSDIQYLKTAVKQIMEKKSCSVLNC